MNNIKAIELRIGNLFQVPSIKHKAFGKILSIYQNGELTDLEYDCEIYKLKGGLTPAFIKDLVPIPLTHEILEKCGATLNNWYRKEIKANNFSFTTLDGSPNSSNKSFMLGLFFEGNACGILIKYLHQLQNLYFALTGEELIL